MIGGVRLIFLVIQGIDFDKLAAKKRFTFVDGLSELFLPKQQKSLPGRGGEKILSKSDLTSVSDEIRQAVEGLKGGKDGSGKVLLIIDQVDLFLATVGDQVTAAGVGEMLMGLREVCCPFPDERNKADDNCKACTCHSYNSLSRLSVSSCSPNATGDGACSALAEFGASGRFHHELEAVRFRNSKGC